MRELGREFKLFPEYFVFSEVELFSLVLCVGLDISEYVAAVLTMPVVGDMLDVVGIIACLVIFRWIGFVSLFELVPGADIFPIFIITWLVWYFLKKTRKERAQTFLAGANSDRYLSMQKILFHREKSGKNPFVDGDAGRKIIEEVTLTRANR